jgi:hypothetical protein
VAQVVKNLPSTHENLSSSPKYIQKKKKMASLKPEVQERPHAVNYLHATPPPTVLGAVIVEIEKNK